MARTQAISLLRAAATKADLTEIYGIVIDSVRKDTLCDRLKSQNYTGDPTSGSAEFNRFVNSKSKPYGTARAAGKGDAITASPVPVNLNVHNEIVEECAKFDLDRSGIGNIMARRASNHIDSMATELDTAFFAAGHAVATKVTPTATEEIDQLEEVAVILESVKNDYVNGVPRNMIFAVCSPSFYSKVRTKLDSQPKSNVDSAAEEFGIYHGISVASSVRLPAGVKCQMQALESIALPVVTYPYGEPEKIPLSNDYASSLFYDYGAVGLTPDLVFEI